MRIIDIAASLGARATRDRNFAEPEALIQYMDRYAVTDAVAHHALAELDPVRGNALMDEISKKHPRLRACHYIDAPSDVDAAEKRLREAKPRAVLLMPQLQNLPLQPFYCGDLFDMLDALRMPVIIPEGQFDYRDLPGFLAEYKRVKLVLLRQGFRRARTTFPLMKRAENVYFDTSTMIDAGILDELIEKFGADRLLFSSGLPTFEPCGPLGLVLYARATDAQKEAILAGNWLRIEEEIVWKR